MKRDFILDLTDQKHLDFFQAVRDRKDILDIFYDEPDKKHIMFTLRAKQPGTCFDKPIVPWKQVKEGDRLWAEHMKNMLDLSGRDRWFPIRITKKYGGVIFFRWLDGPDKGKLRHFEIDSLFADKMVWPYAIALPEDVRIAECYNPKQIYMYYAIGEKAN